MASEVTTMWHVSARRNRESILARGLLLSDSPSKYVWLFADCADAERNASRPWGGCRTPDLYAVDVSGLALARDPHPGWPGVESWVSANPIPVERVRRAE